MQLKIDQFRFNNSQFNLDFTKERRNMTKMINCSSLFKISVIWMQVLQHSFDTSVKKLSNMERKETDNINFVGLVNYKETTMFCMFLV